MIVERIAHGTLHPDGEGDIGCDNCGTEVAVFGVRFAFTSDSLDEPYTSALCSDCFAELFTRVGVAVARELEEERAAVAAAAAGRQA